MLKRLLSGRIAVALALLALVATAARADQKPRIEIVDYGLYDHVVSEIIKAPGEVSGERALVSNVKVRENTLEIAAQLGRMFGYQFRINDPALVGQTLTLRKLVPRLTNPATGQSATVVESEVTATGDGYLHLNAYGFDYGWEMAEGEWTFQVLLGSELLAEKKFKVMVPLN